MLTYRMLGSIAVSFKFYYSSGPDLCLGFGICLRVVMVLGKMASEMTIVCPEEVRAKGGTSTTVRDKRVVVLSHSPSKHSC